MRNLLLLSVFALTATAVNELRAADATVPQEVQTFFRQNCLDCHSSAGAEGALDLTSITPRWDDSSTTDRWVRIFDRVHDGEMPPPDSGTLDVNAKQSFLGDLGDWMRMSLKTRHTEVGRVLGRRLTNLQLERTLHDVLGIDIPLATELPDEPRTDGFTTVADGQPMSHFALERHLNIVDTALDEAFRRATTSADEENHEFDGKDISRRNPSRRTREPEVIDGKAVVWSGGVIFYGRLPATTARDDGWYRFTVKASSLNSPRDYGVWCTVRSGPCVSSAPLLASVSAFEATEEPQEWTFETWLPKGHMLEIRPADATLRKARFEGGQIGTGEGGPQNVPGVAMHSLTMERIHHGPEDGGIRRLLFDDLEVTNASSSRKKRQPARVDSQTPKPDSVRLMESFAERAFRRPVTEEDIAPYVQLVHAELDEDVPLIDALRSGYRALLCSPRFLYLHEVPGPLDDFSVASRLSYFLTSGPPDETLLKLAKAEQLHNADILRQQVRRLLADDGGRRFVEDFAHQWLDLSEIDFTEPDRRLYPGFDTIVQESMLDETHTFLENMLSENLSVTQLIDSETTFLNSRLARYYEIDGVDGDELREVKLEPEDGRGGVLTQGAILKVTANGTNTSPVLRGVWIAERLLGEHIPPPPASVPAIEPDIRGAKTIRELLEKHRADMSCAACHVKIDPAGFALENFDPSGRWREKYYQLDGRRKTKGATVDASYELPDGRAFENVDEFQALILKDPQQLARNVAEKLVTYGTGAAPSFADREAIRKIVDETADTDYGLRSIIEAVVVSELFLRK